MIVRQSKTAETMPISEEESSAILELSKICLNVLKYLWT